MIFRTHSVEERDGMFYVVERDALGEVVCNDSMWANEVDAKAACFFNEALEKHGNMNIAALATGKYLQANGLRPVDLYIAFFDKNTGQVNTNRAFQRIWETL